MRCEHDSCVYTRDVNTPQAIYLLLYVNDMLIACKEAQVIKQVKTALSSRFEMKDLLMRGQLRTFWGWRSIGTGSEGSSTCPCPHTYKG